VKPKEGAFEWGLELSSYGRAGREIFVKVPGKATANVERFSYHYGPALTEWFVNDTRGLEHGFTLRERPAGAGEMVLTLAVRGGLKPRVSGDLVEFVDGAGKARMRYSALTVLDARGRRVPARFKTQGASVRILMDDAEAQYPLTVDPIAQQAYLKASNSGGYDRFGFSVAMSGDTVVVGALYEDSSNTGVNSTPNEAATDSGAAYVFVRNGTVWSQQAYLKASNTGAGHRFGESVAASGDTVVVGGPREASSTTGVNRTPNDLSPTSGAAYVFVRSRATWSQQAYLKASNTGAGHQFGFSVAASGDTVVVGASGESSSYVFVRSGTTWSQQAYLKSSNNTRSFGSPVAASGDTVVVGGANVFVRSGTTWSQQAYLKPGRSVAASGDTVVVGAANISGPGEAYVFVRSGTTWSQQAYLEASNTGAGDSFGWSVAASGDTVVVGAMDEDSSTTGVNSTPNEATFGAGAAYVFVRSGTTWSQQAYLKASNTGENNNFGFSVAASGDTVVVGALGEKSSTTGINSTPNEAAYGAGAAFIFRNDTAPAGSHFIPIEPCRAADTRNPGSSQIPRDSFRNFTFGACNIPFNATAVALNVTLVPSGQFGFLSIWPAGQAQPTVSTMNSLDGRIKATAAIVGVGSGQGVSVYVTDPAHVILDVNGYFVPTGTPGALAFYPVTPCRVVDTRNTGGILAARSTRLINGGCLPSNAQAYSLNVTTVPSGPLGFLTLWPAGATQPLASTLNNLTGTVVANAAVLRAGTGGAFNAYVTDASHLIADLNGYFAPPGSPGALAFYPSSPCRVFDTRNPDGTFGGPEMARDSSRSFTVSSSGCNIPSTAQAYVTNATLVPPGVFGFLTMWPGGQARPTVSVLNAVDGAIASNASIVPAGPGGVIQVYTSEATHLLLDISGYFAP